VTISGKSEFNSAIGTGLWCCWWWCCCGCVCLGFVSFVLERSVQVWQPDNIHASINNKKSFVYLM